MCINRRCKTEGFMWDRIVFFELRHYGDLHITRNFVRYVIDHIPARKYVYVLNNDSKVFSDFSELTFERHDVTIHPFTIYGPWLVIDGTLYINTSCGTNSKFAWQGTTIQTAHSIFKYYLKTLCNHTISEYLSTFVPSINFDKFKVDGVDAFMKLHEGKKKVLVVNGDTQSGQTLNFDMYPLVQILAHHYPDYMFFLSNIPTSTIYNYNVVEASNMDSGIIPLESNIFLCRDIIGIDENDIVETAYFSLFCDVIIGRTSGVYTLSIEKRNVIDNPKKFICISHTELDKDMGMSLLYPHLAENFIWTNTFNFGYLVDLIEQHM